MRELLFSPAARTDLGGIAAYLAREAGRSIAVDVMKRIRERCILVADTPGELGTARPEVREGMRSLPVPPHVLFFRYRDEAVEVVRVLHERRDLRRSDLG